MRSTNSRKERWKRWRESLQRGSVTFCLLLVILLFLCSGGLVTVCFTCLFVQVGDEELGIALMWAASAGKVEDHITNSCLRFTWITLDCQHVMSSECQCRQGEGSNLGNISCLVFAWCLYRDVLWMPVFENYWGNGFDCCSMEKFV